MKYILVLVLMIHTLYAAKVIESVWKDNETFSHYLEKNSIPLDILNNISKEDKKFLSKINKRHHFYELKDEEGKLLQALIPISDVMQIHLSKKKHSDNYDFDIIPIEYESDEYFAKVFVSSNPYTDTLKTIHNKDVANRLTSALKDVVNSKKLHKGDEIDFVYTQSTRAGKPYLMPNIKVARVLLGKKEKFVYVDEDGDGFANTHKSVPYAVKRKRKVTYTKRVPVSAKNSRFGMPLRHARITSSFAYRRWHPILHQYKPHHGTDFGARRGTPLLAVNYGVVSFSGWMNGYGKVVKIKHGDGYESLYAHQSRRRVKVGQRVKRGQIIGYVGSTGRSTGPHLHFGLMKNGRWINPMSVLRKKSIKTSVLKKFTKYENVTTTKYKTVDIKDVKKHKTRLLHYIKENKKTNVWND